MVNDSVTIHEPAGYDIEVYCVDSHFHIEAPNLNLYLSLTQQAAAQLMAYILSYLAQAMNEMDLTDALTDAVLNAIDNKDWCNILADTLVKAGEGGKADG
jgi:hypothetical protein